MRLKVIITTVVLGAAVSLEVEAMDRWAALSQIETRDNDRAVGAAGEISRFQIKPKLWSQYARSDADWRNPAEALAAARQLMKERCTAFERLYNRQPTDFEFYVLWNAPAQVDRPRKAVRERAERFCRLVARDERQARSE
ncbi:MAG TPA: hypothetical protein VFE51_18765 [Verrucomicrobiae bacterium]|nr:hypothetical protein [Verrucomicrobiae bacterium]